MKVISIQKNTVSDDGKPSPKFGAAIHVTKNTHSISRNGIVITRSGVNASMLIPWSEIDALVAKHEPLLATDKT